MFKRACVVIPGCTDIQLSSPVNGASGSGKRESVTQSSMSAQSSKCKRIPSQRLPMKITRPLRPLGFWMLFVLRWTCVFQSCRPWLWRTSWFIRSLGLPATWIHKGSPQAEQGRLQTKTMAVIARLVTLFWQATFFAGSTNYSYPLLHYVHPLPAPNASFRESIGSWGLAVAPVVHVGRLVPRKCRTCRYSLTDVPSDTARLELHHIPTMCSPRIVVTLNMASPQGEVSARWYRKHGQSQLFDEHQRTPYLDLHQEYRDWTSKRSKRPAVCQTKLFCIYRADLRFTELMEVWYVQPAARPRWRCGGESTLRRVMTRAAWSLLMFLVALGCRLLGVLICKLQWAEANRFGSLSRENGDKWQTGVTNWSDAVQETPHQALVRERHGPNPMRCGQFRLCGCLFGSCLI